MNAFHEIAIGAQGVEGGLAHARHDAHGEHDVLRVGDFDAELRILGVERAHAEGDHVHRAALHAAVVESRHRLLHLHRIGPVVGVPGVALGLGADERLILDTGHI